MERDDLISRSALLAELSAHLSVVDMVRVDEIVEGMPAVEAKPVVHAHWIRTHFVSPVWKCSHCGRQINRVSVFDFERCPFCGAHMDEEVTE